MKTDKKRFFSRELSWLEFNARVLSEAQATDVPLLERLKFLTIVSSNFDEFFMVRVASLKAQHSSNPEWRDAAGLTARQQLDRISLRVHELVEMQYACLMNEVLPGLSNEGLRYVRAFEYNQNQTRFLDSYFMNEIFPLLTPLKTDSEGLFPSLGNLRLHAAFLLENNLTVPGGPLARFLERSGVLSIGADENSKKAVKPIIAVVQIPASIPRVVWLPDEDGIRYFALLDDIVQAFGQRLFPGFSVQESMLFKVTRDADFSVDEDREADFIAAIEEVLVSRLSSVPVRMACSSESPIILEYLKVGMRLQDEDVYVASGPIDLPTLGALVNAENFDRLRNDPWKHWWPVDLVADQPLWDEIKRRDILLHVPYQSWDPLMRFINDSADDPAVLAIKMTLYRTSGNSAVVRALARAARVGKHVTVFVELKARFEEERNISWVHRLEEAGVIVVYGLARLKVHAKLLLVIRREPDGMRRYVHLATGNYNDRTARLYSDLSIFTINEEIANDATLFFNMISGCSAILSTRRLIMAPIDMKSHLLSLIDREIGRSVSERPGQIIAKMNSLADPDMIEALYRASSAGVRVQLNVRGVCMLVPGVPGISENISVISIIDRYLEHSRIFWFANAGADELFLSSADWMPRNLDRRVELLFPVLSESIKNTIRDILQLYFSDNVKSHSLMADGNWVRRVPEHGEKRRRAQELIYRAEKRKTELFEQEPQREFTVRRG